MLHGALIVHRFNHHAWPPDSQCRRGEQTKHRTLASQVQLHLLQRKSWWFESCSINHTASQNLNQRIIPAEHTLLDSGVCDDTAGCAGFAFFDNMCYLKSSLMGSYFKAGCQARVRKVEGNCAGFDAPVDGRDLSGVLIRSMYAPNSSVCCSACRSEDRCDGFSYFQNFCYLKTNIQGTFPKAGCSVQLRPGRRLSAEGNLLI